jgi:small GTP-binding protein
MGVSAMDLRGYESAKFEVSELLQRVVTHKLTEDNRSLHDRLQDLFARLAEDRFNLVVAGRFNRGKSSLMNAILGLDRLPTGIVPLTSVITTVSYGTTEKVTIKYQQRRLDSEISLEQLAEYVTQDGNPGNNRGIATANIELSADILRRGFYFIDTPGLGSVIAENTATTNAFLPEADALLLVTSFESPLTEEELVFFTRAAHGDLPVFVVLNKQDLATMPERKQAVAFVQGHLEGLEGRPPVGVFSVSARDALAAKLSDDPELLAASGLPPLEDELVRFLLEKKRTVFLSRMCVRVEELLDDLPTFDGSAALRQQAQALTMKFSGITSVETRAHGGADTSHFNSAQLRSCEICATADGRSWDFLARFQYDLATDRDCQVDFATRSGFCCYHTAEYREIASPFGTCSGYPPLLERLAESLQIAARPSCGDPRTAVAALLPDHGSCLMCAVRDKAEARAVADVSERLRTGNAVTREQLSALCLPHLIAVTNLIDDPEILRALLQQQAVTLERTAEDMRRFTLKQSAARRELQTKEDQTAPQRALTLVAGRRNVNFAAGQAHARSLALRDAAPRVGEGIDHA